MAWRVAKSLLVLRDQVNAAYPKRKKDSDGTIGDEHHSACESDHNPDTDDVVKALDITHDPANGFDSYKFAEKLRIDRDRRIKYIISNRRICSSSIAPWTWRPYTGSNPHNLHVHISVLPDAAHYDDISQWKSLAPVTLAPAHSPPKSIAPSKQPAWVGILQSLVNLIDSLTQKSKS